MLKELFYLIIYKESYVILFGKDSTLKSLYTFVNPKTKHALSQFSMKQNIQNNIHKFRENEILTLTLKTTKAVVEFWWIFIVQ